MTLVLAVLAIVYVGYRLRARPRAKLDSDTTPPLETEDPCPEFSDEELWSWGFCSRAAFRTAELKHYAETACEDSGVTEEQWRQYHGLPLHQTAPKGRHARRVRQPMRQASRSRRAPRRARPSRRARPAAPASADPDPAPRCLTSRDLHEGGTR